MLNHQISDKLLRTYQAGALRNPEKLRALFLRWGEFVAQNIAANPNAVSHHQSNVVTVQFGKR